MSRKAILSTSFTLLMMSAAGCGQLFGNRKVQELQSESDRLLSEYRSEQTRAERLEVQNRALTDRLADMEKRLATIVDGSASHSAPIQRYERQSPVRDVEDGEDVARSDLWQPVQR